MTILIFVTVHKLRILLVECKKIKEKEHVRQKEKFTPTRLLVGVEMGLGVWRWLRGVEWRGGGVSEPDSAHQ